ncbi:MAG TPA: YIP1 family protein [Pyrinomonadaceae bacterium]|nr:YIP1 family protein [Pyrinomonadaceae bacterium]
MNLHRTISLIILGAGLLILVGVGSGILPGASGLASMILVFGVLLYILTFAKAPETEPKSTVAPLTITGRILGAFFQPKRLFQNLRVHPSWIPAFLILALSITIYNVAFVKRIGAGTIAAATLDRVLEGGFMSQDEAGEIRAAGIRNAQTTLAQVSKIVGGVVGWLIFMLLIASLYLMGVAMFGGDMNYLQALSVAMYAALPPFVIQNLMSLLLLFLIPRDDINPIRGQAGLVRADLGLLIAPAEHPLLYVLGTSVSIFGAYWLALTIIGLRNGAARLSMGYTWTISISLWVIGLGLAIVIGTLFPTFIT